MLRLLVISQKLALNYNIKSAVIILMMALSFLISACSPKHKNEIDKLNSISYAYHYLNLDSARSIAYRAYMMSLDEGYDDGKAEALNNMAFVSIARMRYANASKLLLEASSADNQVELLISDILNMRLCQRQSHNKDFYVYQERALERMSRIQEEIDLLTARQKFRFKYAKSEFHIVAATYYYYVGQHRPFIAELKKINPDDIAKDTAQYLSYLYNMGAGDAIEGTSHQTIIQKEFEYLLLCYAMAGDRYPFWRANSLQSLSEHLLDVNDRKFLIKNNLQSIKYLNVQDVSYDLLPVNLAKRSLKIFRSFGDVYQISGAYRTLASCYWSIGDNRSSILCLENALSRNSAIFKAPDLVASIREQLSVVYSAIDDKPNSDRNRNIYLDLQEQTRQDRQLEARAEKLKSSVVWLNIMIIGVVIMIVFLVGLLAIFDKMRQSKLAATSLDSLLSPLREWKAKNDVCVEELKEKYEEIQENYAISQLHLLDSKKQNIEQRAKISLVNSVLPFIDRMIHEVERLSKNEESDDVKELRYQYISELLDTINRYNNILTQWIQLRQGRLSLHIESFSLQTLFDIINKGQMKFNTKEVTLNVKPTNAVVKADKTLTLFMINTLADNSCKFTSQGGKVSIEAIEGNDYVEISISDTGCGMTHDQVEHVFDHKPIKDEKRTGLQYKSHGFGLMNCKGIIEKYKKVSQLFSVCTISAESELGKGSRFSFRLPKGVVRFVLALFISSFAVEVHANLSKIPEDPYPITHPYLLKANVYADKCYESNKRGTYEQTLRYADSARYLINQYYYTIYPRGKDVMTATETTVIPAEIKWYNEKLKTSYAIILDIRNESAVAALALHHWDIYRYNNNVYTQLFRLRSSDNTLRTYVKRMQISENNKMVAIILLVLLLLAILPAYYLLYYRHFLYYRFYLERVNLMNDILLSEDSDKKKLFRIKQLWQKHFNPSHNRIGQSATLVHVVKQIEKALKESIQLDDKYRTNLELASDEVHRVEFENAKLHVSNSILDNCLSSLKHETMYYPSRIMQLIDVDKRNLSGIRELVDYYKELYVLLSSQAMRQIHAITMRCQPVSIYGATVLGDPDMLHYLFDILKKAGKQKSLHVSVAKTDRDYVVYRVLWSDVLLTEEQCRNLFTPMTENIQLMICRQIIRDIGEVTNSRGCGIQAHLDNHNVVIDIVITKAKDKDGKF